MCCFYPTPRSSTCKFSLEEYPLSHAQFLQFQWAGPHLLQSWVCDSGLAAQGTVNTSEMGMGTKKGHCNEKPMHCNQRVAPTLSNSQQLSAPPSAATRLSTTQNRNVCLCLTESLCCRAEINTTL